ncbi:MAG: hypothetical protein ACNA8P_11750, partial [Phycisphaerales bacterium]
RLIVVGIFAMGAIPKFTGGAGELAEKLPGGTAATIAIGLAEVAAIVLILIPKTTLLGSALAAVIMLGAVFSHIVGPVGMEGDLGAMLPMAVIALLAAIASGVLGMKRGYALMPGGSSSQPAGA